MGKSLLDLGYPNIHNGSDAFENQHNPLPLPMNVWSIWKLNYKFKQKYCTPINLIIKHLTNNSCS